MSEHDVEHLLNRTSEVLMDTIHLGEAMLVEFSAQGETLIKAKTHTESIVKQAKNAEHTIRSMRSSPYALWRWCVDTFDWMFSGLLKYTSPELGSVSQGPLKVSSSYHKRILQTSTFPLEAQVLVLHAQANAMGEALDSHLYLLDTLDKTVDKGSTQLNQNEQCYE